MNKYESRYLIRDVSSLMDNILIDSCTKKLVTLLVVLILRGVRGLTLLEEIRH